jgi:hypothetical protein
MGKVLVAAAVGAALLSFAGSGTLFSGNDSAADDGPDVAGEQLDAWLRDRGVIPRGSPVRIAQSETTGRGVFHGSAAAAAAAAAQGGGKGKGKPGDAAAGRTLPKGTSVMCVPPSATWDREALTTRTRLGRECAHLVGRSTGVSAGAFKTLVAMLTAAGAEDPAWVKENSPWLASWPGRWDAPGDPRADGLWQLPTLWPWSQIKELQFPVALVRAEDEYRAIETHVLSGCAGEWIRDAVRAATDVHGGSGPDVEVPVLSEDGTLEGSRRVAREDLFLGKEAFARAFALAQSRWFGSDAALVQGSSASAFELEMRNPYDLDDYIFLPGPDTMNHIKVAGGNAHVLRRRKRDGAHCVITASEVAPGEEMRLDYGSGLPNRVFLATYGFLNPDPRSESVLFTLPSKKLLGKERDPRVAPHLRPALDTVRFEIRRKNHAELLGFNRFVAAKLDLARAEDCFCGMETDFPDYDDCGVSVDVDKQSRETVVTQLRGAIEALPSTLAEDRAELSSMRSIPNIAAGRRMLAIMFRLRLKGILVTQLDAAEQAVKDLERSIELGKPESEWKKELSDKHAQGKKKLNMEELKEHIRQMLEEEDRNAAAAKK